VVEGFLRPCPGQAVRSDEVAKALKPGLGQVAVRGLAGSPTRGSDLIVTEVGLSEKQFCGAQWTFKALEGTSCLHRIPAFTTAKNGL
jgi:hypothetical protein